MLASEKMPWLVVHVATPLVILGALSIDGAWLRIRRSGGVRSSFALSARRAPGLVAAAVLGILIFYSVHTAQLEGYKGARLRLNWWYPEDYKQLTAQTALPTSKTTLTDPELRLKLFKYVIYRELMNPPLGERELWFFERTDLVDEAKWIQ